MAARRHPREATRTTGRSDFQTDREPIVSQLVRSKNISVWLICLLLSILLTAFTLSFESLSAWSVTHVGQAIPKSVNDICVAVLASAVTFLLVGLYYERYVREESLLIFNAQLFNPHVIFEHLNDETVEDIGKAALSRVFSDKDFGSDVFTALTERVRRSNERWYDYSSHQVLSFHPTKLLRDDYFQVTIYSSHRRLIKTRRFDFVIADNVDDWESLMLGKSVEVAYLFRRTETRHPITLNGDAFELTEFFINEKRFTPSVITPSGGRFGYRVELGEDDFRALDDGELQKIRYVYRATVRRRGHVLTQGPAVPAKGIQLSVEYVNTDIAWMGTFPFFTSAGAPVMVDMPSNHPTSKSVTVEGWVLPRSGVAWVWTLKNELLPFDRLSYDQSA